jgi:hypothetical protein
MSDYHPKTYLPVATFVDEAVLEDFQASRGNTGYTMVSSVVEVLTAIR